MNDNIFGGIVANPYAPSGILSAVQADSSWSQSIIHSRMQEEWDKVVKEVIPRTTDDKIKLLRTTNYISLK